MNEQVTISKEDWEKSLHYQHLKMTTKGHYGDRGDLWGKGLRKDACAVGKAGEYAVKLWLNTEFPKSIVSDVGEFIDTVGYGDGGVDLTVDGVTLDIKSTSSGLLIPSTGAGAYKKSCDFFVWCQQRKNLSGRVFSIRGCISREMLSSFDTMPSHVGNHRIYNIPNESLMDLRKLLE